MTIFVWLLPFHLSLTGNVSIHVPSRRFADKHTNLCAKHLIGSNQGLRQHQPTSKIFTNLFCNTRSESEYVPGNKDHQRIGGKISSFVHLKLHLHESQCTLAKIGSQENEHFHYWTDTKIWNWIRQDYGTFYITLRYDLHFHSVNSRGEWYGLSFWKSFHRNFTK